jgi:hypothetical protein
MRPTSKIAFCIVLFSALFAATWGYRYLRQGKKPGSDAVAMMPDDCFIYIRSAGFQELSAKIQSQSLVVDALRGFMPVASLLGYLHAFDSLAAAEPQIGRQLLDNELHLGVFNTDRPQWILAFRISELGRQQEIANALANATRSGSNGERGSFTMSGKKFCYALESGIVMLSDNTEAIAEAIEAGGEGVAGSEGYKMFSGILEDANLCSVYIDHNAYLKSPLNQQLVLSGVLGRGYSGGVASVYPSELRWNGYFMPDPDALLASVLNDPGRETSELLAGIPAGAESFTAYGCNDAARLGSRTRIDSVFWKYADRVAMFNAGKEFYSLLSGEVCSFAFKGTRIGFAGVTDTARVRVLCGTIADSLFHLSGTQIFSLQPDTGKAPLLLDPWTDVTADYALIAGERIYFSADASALSSCANMLSAGQSIAADVAFIPYAQQHIQSRYGYIVYTSPAISGTDGRPMLNLRAAAPPAMGALRHACISLSGENGMFRLRFQLQQQPVSERPATAAAPPAGKLWNLRTDTTVASTPALFINHLNRESELVVTDVSGNLYLMNAKGNLLWKKNLKQPVRSAIYCVDAFRNGKYQMLFATDEHLHLVDRKGNDVKGFPLKLPSRVTSGLSVFDYENNRDYRVLVACADKKIYNYTLLGEKAEGFVPIATGQVVNLSVQYVRAGGSDFLIAIDAGGRIYCHSRRGAQRIILKNRAVEGCTAFFADGGSSPSGSYVYYVDDKGGLLNKISLTDKKEILNLSHGKVAGTPLFAKIDNSRMEDLMICGGGKLSVYDLGGNLLAQKNTPPEHAENGYFISGARKFLFSFSGSSRESVIHEYQGSASQKLSCTRLPLMCNLFRDGKPYVVYVNGSEVICEALD